MIFFLKVKSSSGVSDQKIHASLTRSVCERLAVRWEALRQRAKVTLFHRVQLTGNAATRKFLMQLCSLTAQSPAIHHGRLGS